MSGRLVAVGYRMLGGRPAADASRRTRLLWLRGYYLRMLALAVPVYVVVAVLLPTPWAWVIPGGGLLLWLQGFVSLSRRIRREDRQEADFEREGRSQDREHGERGQGGGT